MAKQVEKQDDALMPHPLPANRRYIFFGEFPPQLWIGERQYENHSAILAASGRSKAHITAIGFVGQWKEDEVGFGADGSSALGIQSGDVTRCIAFLQSLPATRAIKFLVR